MPTFRARAMSLVRSQPGLTAHEIIRHEDGRNLANAAQHLAKAGLLARLKVHDPQFPNLGIWAYYPLDFDIEKEKKNLKNFKLD